MSIKFFSKLSFVAIAAGVALSGMTSSASAGDYTFNKGSSVSGGGSGGPVISRNYGTVGPSGSTWSAGGGSTTIYTQPGGTASQPNMGSQRGSSQNSSYGVFIQKTF